MLVTGSPGRSAAGLSLLLHLEQERQLDPQGRLEAKQHVNAKRLPKVQRQEDPEEFQDRLARFLASEPWAVSLIGAYRDPVRRLTTGILLRELGSVTSALDVSDGLIGDLEHVCERSGVSALLDPARFPKDPDLEAAASFLKRMRTDWSLAPSDDYELLFTAPPEEAANVIAAVEGACAVPVTDVGRIGEIPPADATQPNVRVVGDRGSDAAPQGWDHFRRG